MEQDDYIIANEILRKVKFQRRYSMSPFQAGMEEIDQIRNEMQEAIDRGWERSQGDPSVMAAWNEIMGTMSAPPTVEFFIEKMAGFLKAQRERAPEV